MGRSIGPPDPVPAGKVNDPQSGARIYIDWQNGKMVHRIFEEGISAVYDIRYQIGAGKIGHSYLAQMGDYLLQSPASYYRRYGWDISPGFSGAELLDSDRVLNAQCLFCHQNSTQLLQGRRLTEKSLAAIGCERCHGPTDAHIAHPSTANIVNPAKLPVRARDSVCEQCHLEGAARVLNPGKALRDFRPGNELQSTMVIYVAKQSGNVVRAVSQEEQLAVSRCASESNGKLWCGTCHDPHPRTATDRHAAIRAICTSCHPSLSAASHPSAPRECVSCHMPRRAPADVSHAALTDHRILAKPDSPPARAESAPAELRAWSEPAAELRQRDLALAYLSASAANRAPQFADMAADLLANLSPSQKENDPALLAALGDIDLSRGRSAEAVALFRRACELDPPSAQYAMYLGTTLEQTSDVAGAVTELRRAIELDPSLERPYLELSALFARQGKLTEANQILDSYLKWNPQSILVRLTRETLGAPGK